jgi:Glucuronyl esterase, fungi
VRLSRALDALAQLSEVDATAVIAVGHSRLGKAALWAAATDQRFAGVVSSDSGCGGASLFRHRVGEDIAAITSTFPHSFARRFADYRDAPDELPIDQHHLLALVAPRLTHVASASRDEHADPYGELLSTLHATPVFELYGHQGPPPTSCLGSKRLRSRIGRRIKLTLTVLGPPIVPDNDRPIENSCEAGPPDVREQRRTGDPVALPRTSQQCDVADVEGRDLEER